MAWFEIEGMRLYKPYSEHAVIASDTEFDALEEFKKRFPNAEIGQVQAMKGKYGQICYLDDNGKIVIEPPQAIDIAICNVELRNDGLKHGKLFFVLPITL